MMRLVPKSLRGQLVLLILAALIVAQGLSLWLFVDERSLAVRLALGLEAAERAVNVARLIEQAPEALHPSILRAADSPLVRFSLDPAPAVDRVTDADGSLVASRIRALLGQAGERDIRVALRALAPAFAPMPGMPPEMEAAHRAMMGRYVAPVEMRLSIALASGEWLNVATRFHRPPLQWPRASAITFGLTAALIVAVLWLALSRLTGPLRRLAGAADRLGRGDEVPEITPTGPAELRRLTSAFNEMQARLRRLIDERTRMLAALGHDLRSPITAMRVRAEMVEDEETRERLAATLDEMREMVEATLAFARGMANSEPVETVDLAAFLGALAADIADTTGGPVALEAAAGLTARLRAGAMRRAMRNVIENALRYGDRAEIHLERVGNTARVTVTDDGPGIPEGDLERVFDSFVRVEGSRSRETGGTGLGLSIARTIIHAHGGDIRLANRPEGGLAATIDLPIEGTTSSSPGPTPAPLMTRTG